MEVVVFIAMMIVPIVSLVSLFMVVRQETKVKALKDLVLTFIKESRMSSAKSMHELAMDEFRVNEL